MPCEARVRSRIPAGLALNVLRHRHSPLHCDVQIRQTETGFQAPAGAMNTDDGGLKTLKTQHLAAVDTCVQLWSGESGVSQDEWWRLTGRGASGG